MGRLLRSDNTSDIVRGRYTHNVRALPGYEKHPDPFTDRRAHQMQGREIESDPLRFHNRSLLLHLSLITGRPAYDFQNPVAFFGRLYKNQPTLQPSFTVAAQTPQSIAVNVAAGNTAVKKRY